VKQSGKAKTNVTMKNDGREGERERDKEEEEKTEKEELKR
jgi:hypothetical protein